MKKITKGSTIGLVAPASIFQEKYLKVAIENLEKWGYKVKLGKNIEKKYFSMAGTDEERANDIMDMFSDKEVDAIMSIRGGYGCIRLLEKLDYEVIKNNPKIFIGYSDITALHMAFHTKCNLKTFHGPMAVSNFSGEIVEITKQSLFSTISKDIKNMSLGNENIDFLTKGYAEGELVGGNLAVLTSLIGSKYDLNYENKILFLEDIGESTYKIDRMLWQLKNMGVFNKISGVILGNFKNCNKSSEVDMELKEVFTEHFGNLEIPVVMNFDSGHCEPMITLPFGEKIQLNSEDSSIIIM